MTELGLSKPNVKESATYDVDCCENKGGVNWIPCFGNQTKKDLGNEEVMRAEAERLRWMSWTWLVPCSSIMREQKQ